MPNTVYNHFPCHGYLQTELWNLGQFVLHAPDVKGSLQGRQTGRQISSILHRLDVTNAEEAYIPLMRETHRGPRGPGAADTWLSKVEPGKEENGPSRSPF